METQRNKAAYAYIERRQWVESTQSRSRKAAVEMINATRKAH